MYSNPEISIVMATYNRAGLIGTTLTSFVNQSFQSWECLVIDDGSTDETEYVLSSFKNENRISYFKRGTEHKKGCPGSRNYGLKLAKSDYILFFDDDDIAHPDLLKISLDQLKYHEVDFCRFTREIFYKEEEINFNFNKEFKKLLVDQRNLEEMITNKLPFNSCQVLWKKKCFNDNRFIEDILYSDDWELYSRILSSGVKGVSIDKTLLYARKHVQSSTGAFACRNETIILSSQRATFHVIDTILDNSQMTQNLFKFFVRRALDLKSPSIIEYLLDKTGSTFFTKVKYRLGYKTYPLLKPIFRMKEKLKGV